MKNRLKNLLNAGDRLELSVDGEKRSCMKVETSLEALIDDHRIVIHADACDPNSPIQSSALITLTANKNSSGILEMRGSIIQSWQEGSVTTFVVEVSQDIQRTQRRQHYRLPVLRDVRLGNGSDGYFDGLIQNISAGGLRCILPARMCPGTKINIKLELNQEFFELDGEILEAIEINENTEQFILRIQFVDTPEKTRSRLTAHIFIEESRQKKIADIT